MLYSFEILSTEGKPLYRGLHESKEQAFLSALSNGYSMTNADLSGLNLPLIIFPKCDLRATDLSFTNLSYSDLTNVDLTNANLLGASLKGAKLPFTKLVPV